MTKTTKSSQASKQESFIEPPLVIDFIKLRAQSALSENEQGFIKRRLLENRNLFEKVLQLLLQWGEQANQTIDIEASPNKFEVDEIREIMFKKSAFVMLLKINELKKISVSR